MATVLYSSLLIIRDSLKERLCFCFSDYSLCEVTVEENGLVRQRRLPDSLDNLADRVGLNGRYYLKNNMETGQLLQGDATQVRLFVFTV